MSELSIWAQLALFGGIGLLTVLIGLPLAFQRVKPNRIYGFRTRRTLSDPKIWYRANRILGLNLVVAGISIAVNTAIVVALSGYLPGLPVLVVNLLVFILAMAVAIAHSVQALSRM